MASISDELGAVIIEAAAGGKFEQLKELQAKIGDEREFRKRCSVVTDEQGLSILHYAAGNGVIQMCRFLIEEVKVDVDIKTHRGDTPLLLAVKGGHIHIAKYLIKRGAEIKMRDYQGFTSLHYAAKIDSIELMQLLLIKGADIEADSVGGTPLHCAAYSANAESIAFLLERGAEPNAVCKLIGCSPMLFAIVSHSCECMELLLKAGTDPNKYQNGCSPLHAAAETEGATNCLKSLLAAGADTDAISSYGLRPIEHAGLAHNLEAVRILCPVTPRIEGFPDWSVDGVMECVHSQGAGERRIMLKTLMLGYLRHQGRGAWSTQNYSSAVAWYTEAIYNDQSDEKLLSNRSLCWALMGDGVFALHDAENCVRLKPNWAKAHYREGAAWMLLKNYRMAADAYKKAYELAPENEEIKRAYRESVEYLLQGISIGGVDIHSN